MVKRHEAEDLMFYSLTPRLLILSFTMPYGTYSYGSLKTGEVHEQDWGTERFRFEKVVWKP